MVRIKDLILSAAGASGVSYGRAAGLFANVLILMAVCALPLKAQQTQYVSLPYSCSFEVSESAETQEWTLNGAVDVVYRQRDLFGRGTGSLCV